MKSFNKPVFIAFYIVVLVLLSYLTLKILYHIWTPDLVSETEQVHPIRASIYDSDNSILIDSVEDIMLSTLVSQSDISLPSINLTDIPKDELELYPNPVTDRLYLDITPHHEDAYEARVIDILGRIYLTRYIVPTVHSYTVSFPVASLDPGVYFLCLRSTNETMLTGKFIKE